MRRLLLVPADTAPIARAHAAGDHPRVDFLELARELDAEILSWSHVEACTGLGTRLVRGLLGRNVALAWMGWLRGANTVFTTAENVGLALALMLRLSRRRVTHVMIGHKLSTPSKARLIRRLGLQRAVDGVIAYTSRQTGFARDQLGFDEERLHRIHFHADTDFFSPPDPLAVGDEVVEREGVISVGRELRDYPTLIAALAERPELPATLVGGSPWSRREDQLEGLELPARVTLRSGLSHAELRDLTRRAAVAVVPLQAVDSPAGVTAIFEALACGTPVICSATEGIADSLHACPGVVSVPPGDAAALGRALDELLGDEARREAMGRAGREVVVATRSLDVFVERIGGVVRGAEERRGQVRRRRGLGQLVQSAWPAITARLFLGGLQHVGRRVRTYGKPRITNLGRMTVGDRCTIFSQTVRSEFVSYECGTLEVGDGVFINYGASISAHDRVAIGDGCQIGSYAILMDNDYHRVGALDQEPDSAPIILGRNVWLGVRVTVLKGVTIGDNAVVGAGSVVTRSVPPNSLVVGVPAKVVRSFDPPPEQPQVQQGPEGVQGAGAREGLKSVDAAGR